MAHCCPNVQIIRQLTFHARFNLSRITAALNKCVGSVHLRTILLTVINPVSLNERLKFTLSVLVQYAFPFQVDACTNADLKVVITAPLNAGSVHFRMVIRLDT